MNLNELEILEDDFDVFVALDDKQKIEFLFDAIEDGIEASVLKQVDKLSQKFITKKQSVRSQDILVDGTRTCITFSKHELHINSESLSSINKVVNKFANDGLLMFRIKKNKSVFDFYKYFKAYKVLGQVGPLSSN